jgi:hypothetical protein
MVVAEVVKTSSRLRRFILRIETLDEFRYQEIKSGLTTMEKADNESTPRYWHGRLLDREADPVCLAKTQSVRARSNIHPNFLEAEWPALHIFL